MMLLVRRTLALLGDIGFRRTLRQIRGRVHGFRVVERRQVLQAQLGSFGRGTGAAVEVKTAVHVTTGHNPLEPVKHSALLFGQEVVRRGHMIVLVQFQTPDCKVTGEAKGVQLP